MNDWRFLTNPSRALLGIARDPESRLRDLATSLDMTERIAYRIVIDLTQAGYVARKRGSTQPPLQLGSLVIA
jgi:DNA-binding IclR family transcriptional regulator